MSLHSAWCGEATAMRGRKGIAPTRAARVPGEETLRTRAERGSASEPPPTAATNLHAFDGNRNSRAALPAPLHVVVPIADAPFDAQADGKEDEDLDQADRGVHGKARERARLGPAGRALIDAGL